MIKSVYLFLDNSGREISISILSKEPLISVQRENIRPNRGIKYLYIDEAVEMTEKELKELREAVIESDNQG